MKQTLLSTTVFFAFGLRLWAVGFVVTPPRIDLTTIPSETETYNISVLNLDSVTPVKLRGYLMDWSMKPDGNMEYSKPGVMAYSCSNWIELNPAEFEVPPRTEQVIRYTVKVPDSCFGSYRSLLFFESQPDTNQKAMVGLVVKARVGVPIYVTIPGTEVKQAQFTGLAYKRKGPQTHEFKLQVANTGNVHIRPKGTLTVRDSAGATAATLPLNDEVVLPQARRDIILTLNQPLAPGRYKLTASIDYGTVELLEAETTIEVKP